MTSHAAREVRGRLNRLVKDVRFERTITGLIVVNAITIGLETSSVIMTFTGPVLIMLNHVILSVFVGELLLRIGAQGRAFFREPWNLFDLIVIGLALVPLTENPSVMRALRVLRVLRLASIFPRMQRVVTALLEAVPSIGAVVALLAIVFYVAGVMAIHFFGDIFPEWFGTLPRSLYSLFQVMTLESWSMGIVRPVMDVYPYAWAFFASFILISTFTMLNLFIAVVVNTYDRLETEAREDASEERKEILEQIHFGREERRELMDQIRLGREERKKILDRIEALREDLKRLREGQTDGRPSSG